MRGYRLVAVVAALAAGAAAADPVPGRTAQSLVFPAGQSETIVSSRLDGNGQAMVRLMVPLMERQLGRSLQYYGAIAISPDEGFQSDASQSALNHHSVGAADAAALAACNARRARGTAPCILAARIVPAGYRDRALTLSAAATAALAGPYRQARAPKALAVSPSTGAFGVGAPAAALRTCRDGAGGAEDCRIVVQD